MSQAQLQWSFLSQTASGHRLLHASALLLQLENRATIFLIVGSKDLPANTTNPGFQT